MKSLLTLPLAALLVSASAFSAEYKPGHYDIDTAHSKLGFEVAHLVISSVEGRFTKFNGKVDLAEKFEKSRFTVDVDLASVDTSVAKRDAHLRSPDFFDVKKYPEMKFESTGIEGSPDSFRLTGNLTIHGVTKKVTFDASYAGAVNDGSGHEKVAFSGKTKINRKDFGLKWGGMIEAGPVVGDDVSLDLHVEAGRPLAKK
jgi:polyisoprenoid-binding protein YceI